MQLWKATLVNLAPLDVTMPEMGVSMGDITHCNAREGV